MKKPLGIISIIMSTYNRADLILETIESIQKQTYSNWELIIVDDGSEDNTAELIRKLHDSRIKFYSAGRIGIGGKIKNIGIEKSNRDLIAFIDSDDLWAPTKLEMQVKSMEEYPEAGFCLTGGYNFRNRGEPVNFFYKAKEGLRYDNVFFSCFKSEVACFTQTLMIKRKCLETTGFFKEEKSFSDVEFIYNLAYYFKAVILYEPLVFRRLHASNYITPNWEKSNFEGIEIIKSFKDELPAKIFSYSLFKVHLNFGEKYLKEKERKKALSMYFLAWRYKPLSIVPVKKIAKTILYSLTGK